MKLKIVHLIFVFLLFFTNIECKEKSDLQNWNYKGNVKSSRLIFYEIEEEENENLEEMKEWFDEVEYTFNEQGNILKFNRFNSDGSLNGKSITIYDSLNIKIESKFFNSKGELTNQNSFRYDMNGNLTNLITYNPDGSISFQKKFSYDDFGNNIEDIVFRETYGKSKYEYKYDTLGNVIESIWFDSKGELVSKTILEYDSNGNIISRKNFYFSLELNEKIIYEFDSYGNRIKEEVFSPKGKLRLFKSYDYEYDEFNNWVIEKEYIKDKLRNIIERRITYY